jgi:hypothetical protein
VRHGIWNRIGHYDWKFAAAVAAVGLVFLFVAFGTHL